MRVLYISDIHYGDDLANELNAKIKKSLDSHQVVHYNTEDLVMNDCLGCFSCWVKTPGICIHHDTGAKLCRDYISCDQVLLLTPIRFGCYSPAVKRVFERISPINLPFIQQSRGKSHHAPRYSSYPEITVIGYGEDITIEEEKTLAALSYRNAVNFQKKHAKSAVCRRIEEADGILKSLGLISYSLQGEMV